MPRPTCVTSPASPRRYLAHRAATARPCGWNEPPSHLSPPLPARRGAARCRCCCHRSSHQPEADSELREAAVGEVAMPTTRTVGFSGRGGRRSSTRPRPAPWSMRALAAARARLAGATDRQGAADRAIRVRPPSRTTMTCGLHRHVVPGVRLRRLALTRNGLDASDSRKMTASATSSGTTETAQRHARASSGGPPRCRSIAGHHRSRWGPVPRH